MAESALKADRLHASVRVEESGNTKDRVQPDEGQRVGRVVKIESAVFQLGNQVLGEGIHVDFEPHGEGGLRAHTSSHPTEHAPLDRLV